MRRSIFFILSCLLLTACNPNKPTPEQPENATTLSVEQQKRDAAALLEAKNALLDQAKVDLSQTESLLNKRTEIELVQKEQTIIAIAKHQKANAEQRLIETAKMESDKAQARLKQAASAEKTTPDSKF